MRGAGERHEEGARGKNGVSMPGMTVERRYSHYAQTMRHG